MTGTRKIDAMRLPRLAPDITAAIVNGRNHRD
jgi:hypothetical protein